jgi:hypothetical protein
MSWHPLPPVRIEKTFGTIITTAVNESVWHCVLEIELVFFFKLAIRRWSLFWPFDCSVIFDFQIASSNNAGQSFKFSYNESLDSMNENNYKSLGVYGRYASQHFVNIGLPALHSRQAQMHWDAVIV